MSSLRHPAAYSLAAALCVLVACEPAEPEGSTPSRFASVKQASSNAASSFCEKQWPAASSEARKYVAIPEQPLPDAPAAAAVAAGSWRWVNLWATWCMPCLGEMGLLGKWQRSLQQDGIGLDIELWSVDEDEAQLKTFLATTKLPGRVRWLRAQQDLPAVLASLGADANAGIPVHALVDGSGNLRCLRVGSVHDEDYGAVKAILSGS